MVLPASSSRLPLPVSLPAAISFLPTLSSYAVCLRYLPTPSADAISTTLSTYAISVRYLPMLYPKLSATLSAYTRGTGCAVLSGRRGLAVLSSLCEALLLRAIQGPPLPSLPPPSPSPLAISLRYLPTLSPYAIAISLRYLPTLSAYAICLG
eukprot:3933172-Rhodomonas_salina.3